MDQALATEPSPTAEATRLMDPCRTSPTANTPGMPVSNSIGGRSSGHPAGGPSPSRSAPVSTNPLEAMVHERPDIALAVMRVLAERLAAMTTQPVGSGA